ncbi:MAG TPA: hypothetical protein VMV72_01625 [Verrucomicrobiae bacterium]|nr:hypothetical protein [Verrucomicrobiae bacterium]
MPATLFDKSLVMRRTPWAACAALENFLSTGGQCPMESEMNWIGIEQICASNANGEPDTPNDMTHSLAWAHLAISIDESMASAFTGGDTSGIIGSAMWVRANMIAPFGHHPKDPICDLDTVVEWCMTPPEVQRLLKAETPPPYDPSTTYDSIVRGVEQRLIFLVDAGRLKEEGSVGRLLGIIRQARAAYKRAGAQDDRNMSR